MDKFALPSDANAMIRFLPEWKDREYFRQQLIPDVHLEHYIAPNTVKVNLESIGEEPDNPFSPYPFSSLYSYGQMQAMNSLRQNLNVLEIKTKRVPIPKRKKKSWLRYVSNKKWSRKFTPKYVRVVGNVKTLSIGGDFIEKLRNIVKSSKLVHGRMAGA